ncbi:hypothetical protein [Natronomonas sp.]|uniref:hypothetical protein n=1 Tax=Natronomonas sp. TaxID=2184060 RepID=UPI002626741B|nr:hypothetical protein [Natronomonas sp.]
MTSRRRRAVRGSLVERGYDVSERDGRLLADPTAGADPIGVPGALLVVEAGPDPTALLEAVGSAAAADRTALVVSGAETAGAIRRTLTDPPGLAARTERTRTFYNAPDRLPAGQKGLACCRADATPVWREEPMEGVTGEGTRYVLYADGDPVTAFESVAALSCPSAAAFEYAYRRGDDGRFRVEKLRSGRTVGRFVSVRELKANAYRPVPVPLVPEDVVEGYLPEAWALAVVEDDRVVSIEGA